MMVEGVKVRRACFIMGISRAEPYREPVPDRDGPLKEALQRVWRPNMGYRMAHALIQKEFELLNVKRTHRVWKELKLGRVKRYRKKRTGASVALKAVAPNQVWCVDFIHDACLNGTKLKILSVVDEFTRECLALEVATKLNAASVRRVLAPLILGRGAPAFVRSDNGSEFIARLLAVFLSGCGSGSHFIRPGSPWQNPFVESFHSTFRREHLDAHVFTNLADAQVKVAVWRRWYNEERPHSSLGYEPPALAARIGDSGRATPSLHPQSGVQPISSTTEVSS
ncbi:MAG: IS3 family transposase [Fimbriimonadaceae bacterium]|nr:IS3 family transposase [Fimbriimonadaceae bacterium]